MTHATLRSAVAAWPAAERRWYLDLVAQANGSLSTTDGGLTALERYESLPWDSCILLAGDGERRISDANGSMWSTDRHGRWFMTPSKKMLWLHQRIGQLGNGGSWPVGNRVVASHICGYCHCIRAEHIIYQSVAGDRRDRSHHKLHGRGSFRPEHVPKHLAISSPVSVIGAGCM